jgi:AraC-like DNA-binding protein
MDERATRTAVAEHSSRLGSWRMEFLTPSERLAPFVRRFNAYRERDTGFARRRELPSPLATMVFNLGSELRVEHPLGTRTTYQAGAAFYSGMSATYAVTETDGAQEGAQVMLTTLGARRLLGIPLIEIGDRLTDPYDLFGAAARDMAERLQEANSSAGRLAILEQEITQGLARSHHGPPRDLIWALRRIEATSGRIRVNAVAKELGCSRKHLTVRFRREFGLPPKLFARVARFDHAVQLLRRNRVASLADLACVCGYADQAHLTRELDEFAGSPPTAFLRRKLPDEGGFVD